MKHPLIPITLTPENRAQWIKDNAVETIQHVEKIELEPELIHELESKSSLASRAIDRLEAVKKEFMDVLKEGTHTTPGELIGDDPIYIPYDIVIPPTSGLKALKAKRSFADKQLEQGFTEQSTELYVIPYPEDSLMVAVDIEGEEWEEQTKAMTDEEVNQYKPMLKKEKKPKKADKNFMNLDEAEDDDAQPTLDL